MKNFLKKSFNIFPLFILTLCLVTFSNCGNDDDVIKNPTSEKKIEKND